MGRIFSQIVLQQRCQFKTVYRSIVVRCIGIRRVGEIFESNFVSLHAVKYSRGEKKVFIKFNFHTDAGLETVFKITFLFLIKDEVFGGSGLGACKNAHFRLLAFHSLGNQKGKGGDNYFFHCRQKCISLKVAINIGDCKPVISGKAAKVSEWRKDLFVKS